MPGRQLKRGLVQVYTGNGKGKTTAALGLAIRAAGQGMRVFIGQFMKGVPYGELEILIHVSNITIRQFGSPHWVHPKSIRDEDRRLAEEGFEEARKVVLSEEYDVAILDEINVVLAFGLLPLEPVLDLIANKPAMLELVLTGRGAPREIMEVADLVTEMVPVKHPFDKGIEARRGIEF